VINRARTNAKIAATKSLLMQVCGALDRYSQDWGTYPPDWVPIGVDFVKFESYTTASPTFTATVNATAEALYYYLANPNITRKHPYIELQAEVQYAPGNAANALRWVCDSWQRPFLYNRRAFATGGSFNCTQTDVLSNPAYSNTYDLYSVGPNGQTNLKTLPKPITNASATGYATALAEFNRKGLNKNGYGADEDDIGSWD